MPKTITDQQAETLLAFITAVELRTLGAWPAIQHGMREDAGIVDPDGALEDAKEALQS